MKLKDLLINVDIVKMAADEEMDISGIGNNSLTIREGELFVAIRGYATDGHKYIGDVVIRGAACVVCENEAGIIASKIPYVKVENSRIALAQMSAAWFKHPAKKMKLIGVTGTSGKTSTTYYIKHILEKCSGEKVGLIGTNGNFIGDRELATKLTTPDAYELQSIFDKMAFEGCKYVVMEVSSHALYLHRVYGVEFDVGIFTNLSPEHLDFHVSMDEYAKTKARLFAVSNKSVINIDDDYAGYMKERCSGDIMTYAINNSAADLVGKDVKLYPDKTEYCALLTGKVTRVKLHMPGMFSVYNTLAAILAAISLGFDIDNIAESLLSCEGVRGRAEVLPLGCEFTVIVDYAHKPDALENIIKTARTLTKGRLYTLFGCGGDRDTAKRPLMGEIAMKLSDTVIVTSDNPRTEVPHAIIDDILIGVLSVSGHKERGRLIINENRRDAIHKAIDCLKAGDVLLIAGKGHETYQILGKETIHFDDREVVMEYVKKLKDQVRKQRAEEEL